MKNKILLSKILLVIIGAIFILDIGYYFFTAYPKMTSNSSIIHPIIYIIVLAFIVFIIFKINKKPNLWAKVLIIFYIVLPAILWLDPVARFNCQKLTIITHFISIWVITALFILVPGILLFNIKSNSNNEK